MKLRASIALSVAAGAALLLAVPTTACSKQIAHGITAVMRPVDLP